MDFQTTHVTPLKIRLNGQQYDVPRFLLPNFKKWAAEQSSRAMSEALDQLPDEQSKARFRLFFVSPPIDVVTLADQLRAPEGVEYVIRTCLTSAKVPTEQIDQLLTFGDPMELRLLADELGSVRRAVEQLKAKSDDPGASADPLPQPPAA